MTDCSDIASGAFVMAVITATIGFVLGWWIKKALMLEEFLKKAKVTEEKEKP